MMLFFLDDNKIQANTFMYCLYFVIIRALVVVGLLTIQKLWPIRLQTLRIVHAIMHTMLY